MIRAPIPQEILTSEVSPYGFDDRASKSIVFVALVTGGSTDIIELLPHPSAERNWSSSVPRDHSVYNADSIFSFDGRTIYAAVPNEAIPERPRKNFTVTFWMKHQGEPQTHAGRKETVVCDSDDRSHSRHHFSVFVRNCKLMMLLRHEAKLGENMKTFR